MENLDFFFFFVVSKKMQYHDIKMQAELTCILRRQTSPWNTLSS